MAIKYRYLKDYLSAIRRSFVVDRDQFGSAELIFSEADRIEAINEARNVIAVELLCIPSSNTVTLVTGTKYYDLTSRNSRLVYVDEVYHASRKLYRTNNYADILPGASNSTPLTYYIDPQNHYIWLQPPPSTVKTLSCRTFSLPTEFTGANDAETIPNQFREMVVQYTLSKGFERDDIKDGLAKSQFYRKQFEDNLNRAKKWRRVI